MRGKQIKKETKNKTRTTTTKRNKKKTTKNRIRTEEKAQNKTNDEQ